MKNDRYFLGVDLGTSSMKVLLTDARLNVICRSQRTYLVSREKARWAEQNPDDWWTAFLGCLSDIGENSGVPLSKISALGFSGQMHGLVCVDEKAKPIRPAVIWMDQRSSDECKSYEAKAYDIIKSEIKNRPFPGMLLPSLLWIKKNEPENYKKIYKVLLPKDYLRLRLSGVFASDEGDASASLGFNVRDRKWSENLFDRLEIRKDIFPEIYKSCENTGSVNAFAASETGLSEGTVLSAGGGDAAMMLLGNGIFKPGQVSCSIGTSAQIATVTSEPLNDETFSLQSWCYVNEGTWYTEAGSLNGGTALSWLKNEVFSGSKITYAEIDEKAMKVKPGSEGLIFLPYLSGERTPFLKPEIAGVFSGLRHIHGQGHMARAVMEGVTLNLAICLKRIEKMGIRPDKIITSGGGAKGTLWRQIQADIFELPVVRAKSEEAAFGAVITAFLAAAGETEVGESVYSGITLKDEAPIFPIEKNVKIYRERAKVFEEEIYKNYGIRV